MPRPEACLRKTRVSNNVFLYLCGGMFRFRKFISLTLVVVYAFFLASTTMFYHSHQLADFKLVHSHPFTSHGHTHTAGQILLIDIVDSAAYKESPTMSVPVCAPVAADPDLFVRYVEPVLAPVFFLFSLKAPPASC